MDRTGRLVRAARRRLTIAAVVENVGGALVWAAALALALTVVVRGAGLDASLPWWVPLASALALGAAIGACFGLLRSPKPLAAAAWVDGRLRLKDRLSTGTALANVTDDAFALLAVAESDAAAASVNLATTIKVRWGQTWLVCLLFTGMAITAGLLPSNWARIGASNLPDQLAEAGKRESLAREIEQAARVAKTHPPIAAASPRQIEELEEIQRQLAAGRSSPEDAASEAARSIDRLSDEAERRADRTEQADQMLRDGLASLAKGGTATDDAQTSRLAEAIRRGELDTATDAARQLLNPEPATRPQDRKDIAESLDRLARDLESLADAARKSPTGESGVDQALRDAGADPEAAREITERGGQDELRRALEQAGTPAEESGKLADRTQRDLDERRAREQAAQDLQSLKESLERAAEELRNNQGASDSPPRSTKPENAQPQAQGDRPGVEQSGEPRPPESPNEGRREPESGGQPQTARKQPAGDGVPPSADSRTPTGADRGGQPAPDSPQRTPETPASKQEATRRGTTQPTPANTPSRDPAPAEPRPDDKTRAATPGKEHDGQAQPAKRPDADAQPLDAPPSTPRSSEPSDRESPGSSVQDLTRRLERLAQAAKNAAGDRQAAEEMRRLAQEMLDRSSPEQREQLQRMAERAMGRSPSARGADPGTPGAEGGRATRAEPPGAPAPTRTQLIDARSRDDLERTPRDEHTAAEWLATPTPGTAPAPELARRIERAQRSAEQAIENRSIPPRFDALLRRYFQRLPDQIRPPAQSDRGPPGPAEPAKDAE